ncbi:MAG: aminotransferase class I/II-fold pyridoxal phosphate-dependent enzyme, partial [Deferribacterales bacterium]
MVEKLIKKIDDVKKSGNYRQFTYYEQKKGKYIIIDGKEYLSLTTNDYLGLGTDSKLLKKFYQSDLDLNRYGFSTASSRLLGGNSILYKELEDRLSDFLSKEKTIVFNSGYHLNSGVLAAITDKRDLILSDKLNHASIVDGVRLSGAEVVRYRHLDYDF